MAVSNSLEIAIKKSVMFAKTLGESKVETEHLLFGILSVTESKASKLLAKFGIQSESYRRLVLSLKKTKNVEVQKVISYSKTVSSIFAKTTDFCKKNGRDLLEIEDVLYILH